MSRSERGRPMPRAMIHRRILDVAASDPDASLAAIAEEVSGASPELVERVLDEYGDPGTGADPDEQEAESMNSNGANSTSEHAEQPTSDTVEQSTTAEPGDPPASGSDDQSANAVTEQSVDEDADQPESEDADRPASDAADQPTSEAVDPSADVSLSEKQRRTLRALSERPDAAQGALADELDVTRATVSRRLNSIPGFEWAERRAFVESFFDGESADDRSRPADGGDSAAPADGDDSAAPADGDDSSAPADGDDSSAPADDVDAPVEKDDSDGEAAVEELRATLTDVERRLSTLEADRAVTDGDESAVAESGADEREDGANATAADLSPELAHKVVHACMESDRLTEDEELAVLRSFMGD